MDWQAINKTLSRVYLQAPIVDGELNLESWVRWFKVAGDMHFTADENARFADGVGRRDCAVVDWLDFDVELADDAEWERAS